MHEDQWRDSLTRAELNLSGLLSCNKLLAYVTAILASLSLVLAAGLGYVLGRQAAYTHKVALEPTATEKEKEMEVMVGGKADSGQKSTRPPQLESILHDPSDNVLQPRLNSKDGLRPVKSERYLEDLDSAKQGAPPDNPEGKTAGPEVLVPEALVSNQDAVETWKLQHLPDSAQRIYRNAQSVFGAVDLPWGEPAVRRKSLGSKLGSALPSAACSELSAVLTAQSSLEKWTSPGFNYKLSNLALLGLGPTWEILREDLSFLQGQNGKWISLSSGRRGATYKAVLLDKISVAVKCLRVSKELLPDERLGELALQQLALNHTEYFVPFHGICRTDDTVMLVYDFIEGGNMTEAIKRDPVAMQWYKKGKNVACSAAQGLAHLHKHDAEHRSMKSSQILIHGQERTALIGDAGLQAVAQYCNQQRNSRFISNLNWGAPEVLTGKRCGSEADIFAFANVLWELVTQEMPIREAFRFREAESPAECPLPIKDLIQRCRAADPSARPTADEVVSIIKGSWHMTQDGGGTLETKSNAAEHDKKDSALKRGKADLDTARQSMHSDQRRSLNQASAGSGLNLSGPSSQVSPPGSQIEAKALRPMAAVKLGLLGRPPPSPQTSPDSRERHWSPLRQKSASLGGFFDRTEMRSLLRGPLLGQPVEPAPKATSNSQASQQALKLGSKAEKGLKTKNAILALERRIRGYDLHPIKSACEVLERGSSSSMLKSHQHSRKRLNASLASSRDLVLAQTRSPSITSSSGQSSGASEVKANKPSPTVDCQAKPCNPDVLWSISHCQEAEAETETAKTGAAMQFATKPKNASPSRCSYMSKALSPAPSQIPPSLTGKPSFANIEWDAPAARAKSERQMSVRIKDFDLEGTARSFSASEIKPSWQSNKVNEAELLDATQLPALKIAEPERAEMLKAIEFSSFPNPFAQAQMQVGTPWNTTSMPEPVGQEIPRLGNPSDSQQNPGCTSLQSSSSATASLEPGLVTRHSSTRLGRWKKKCDITFTKWLAPSTPLSSGETTRPESHVQETAGLDHN